MAAARAPQGPQAGGLLICTPAKAAVTPLRFMMNLPSPLGQPGASGG